MFMLPSESTKKRAVDRMHAVEVASRHEYSTFSPLTEVEGSETHSLLRMQAYSFYSFLKI